MPIQHASRQRPSIPTHTDISHLTAHKSTPHPGDIYLSCRLRTQWGTKRAETPFPLMSKLPIRLQIQKVRACPIRARSPLTRQKPSSHKPEQPSSPEYPADKYDSSKSSDVDTDPASNAASTPGRRNYHCIRIGLPILVSFLLWMWTCIIITLILGTVLSYKSTGHVFM